MTRLGTLRLRIARVRGRAFLPAGIRAFQRRAENVMVLIREAFLRGTTTRQVGRVVALVTGEAVSAQTVSTLTRSLDRRVQRFHEAPLKDEWAYWFLDGVSLRVRRPAGRKRVQRCWGPTGCGATDNGAGWPFRAARERARRPGRGSCKASIGAGCKASAWS